MKNTKLLGTFWSVVICATTQASSVTEKNSVYEILMEKRPDLTAIFSRDFLNNQMDQSLAKRIAKAVMRGDQKEADRLFLKHKYTQEFRTHMRYCDFDPKTDGAEVDPLCDQLKKAFIEITNDCDALGLFCSADLGHYITLNSVDLSEAERKQQEQDRKKRFLAIPKTETQKAVSMANKMLGTIFPQLSFQRKQNSAMLLAGSAGVGAAVYVAYRWYNGYKAKKEQKRKQIEKQKEKQKEKLKLASPVAAGTEEKVNVAAV
ncbi:hypothetical protein IPH25_01610 [bacterium]|nr:MAG: hypothetical protein IPG37_03740 [bacterium]QQR62123.1 MAG: hypothetical protein IPH25_01610 [bacterium]QQR63319.1 MAG: hypothetical protein IPH67_02500 [bacterium]